jgi:hypothetical protein
MKMEKAPACREQAVKKAGARSMEKAMKMTNLNIKDQNENVQMIESRRVRMISLIFHISIVDFL